MPTTLLIVEDEIDLRAALEYNLRQEGYETILAGCGEDALKYLTKEPYPDLVLLDLMLPDIPGTEVCRRLKGGERTRDIPVVMLTAKGEEIDRVVGFELGADDYVVKPFSVRELLLRIRAVLRRRQEPGQDNRIHRFGCLEIDSEACRVWVQQGEVTLTALEWRLLSVLFERKGRVQTRNTLLNDVWGIQADVTTRTVDTHVKRLRQKLGEAGDYIETLRGLGYRLLAEPPGHDAG